MSKKIPVCHTRFICEVHTFSGSRKQLLTCPFLTNVDPAQLKAIPRGVDTLVIIASNPRVGCFYNSRDFEGGPSCVVYINEPALGDTIGIVEPWDAV